MEKTLSQELLLYWSPDTADDVFKREDILNYVASNQLKRASVDDVIWVVTVYHGELFLLGRLIVDAITDRNGAIKILGQKDVWGNKDYYGISNPSKAEKLKKISLKNDARKFVFKSSNNKHPNLSIGNNNSVNPQELQTMRILSPATAQLFDQIWKKF